MSFSVLASYSLVFLLDNTPLTTQQQIYTVCKQRCCEQEMQEYVNIAFSAGTKQLRPPTNLT